MQIDTYISVTKAKTQLLDMIRIIDEREDTVAITKNGVPKAVLMSMDQYESMVETITVLGDQEMMDQIRRSGKEMEENRPLIDLEELS